MMIAIIMRGWACALALLLAGCSVGGDEPDGGMDGDVVPEVDAGSECASDLDCGDQIACTIDHCEAGSCVHNPCADCCPEGLECIAEVGCGAIQLCDTDAECDDGVRCTLDVCRDGEYCEHRPQNELCEAGEGCFPALGCIPAPPESCETPEDCTGGNACLGTWRCEEEFGCAFVAPPECDDGDACTNDGCDGAAGMCVHEIRDADMDGHGDDACGGDDCDDADEAVYPGATEVCDGDDEDCDGMVDETCCMPGGACTTSCSTGGTITCNPDGTETCTPPAETCNGADDDCDGAPDQTFECVRDRTRPCDPGCGSMGTQTCVDCAWDSCVAPPEACGGGDDDCDGMVDETFACSPGTMGSCPTGCGSMGTRGCLGDCSWDSCIPPPEICNGVDDDCDMACDDGFTCCAGSMRSCTTLGFVSGDAICRSDCSGFDTSGCSNCGNAMVDAGEDCDGSALGGNDCTTVPGSFGSGTLRCTSGCAFDTAGCSLCQNGTLDPGEDCDGAALGGNDCTTIGGGYTAGTLGCTSACTFDTSMCTAWTPNGVYTLSPPAVYSCAFGLVNYNESSFTFTDDGVTLTVTGGRCPMVGPSVPRTGMRSFTVTCTVPGGCDEVYTLTGTFTSDISWTGTYTAQWIPSSPGACADCVDQSHPMTGTR